MWLFRMVSIGVVALGSVLTGHQYVYAQKKPASKPATIAPAEKLDAGWERIDSRLVFLMVRLANVEGGLEAIDKEESQKRSAGDPAWRSQASGKGQRKDGPKRWRSHEVV